MSKQRNQAAAEAPPMAGQTAWTRNARTPGVTALAADIAEALGKCTICGVAIDPNRSVTKDGDGYRHSDCEPNSTLPDAMLPESVPVVEGTNLCPVSYPHLPHDYCDGKPSAYRQPPASEGVAGVGFPGPDRHAIPKSTCASPDEVDAKLTELEQRQAARSNAGGAKPAKRGDAELRIMRRMLALLDELPNEAAKRRCVAWFRDRFEEDRPF